jgi:ribose 5-phosphate isomerase B
MIYLGSDHAGWQLKQDVKKVLYDLGLRFDDLGNAELKSDDDYPDYAFKVGEAVAKDPKSFGILLCGSAQGICIAANKVKGVRAVAVSTIEGALKTRQHNDANVLCLSGWTQGAEKMAPVIKAFLETNFSGEARHVRRIGEITAYEHGR